MNRTEGIALIDTQTLCDENVYLIDDYQNTTVLDPSKVIANENYVKIIVICAIPVVF